MKKIIAIVLCLAVVTIGYATEYDNRIPIDINGQAWNVSYNSGVLTLLDNKTNGTTGSTFDLVYPMGNFVCTHIKSNDNATRWVEARVQGSIDGTYWYNIFIDNMTGSGTHPDNGSTTARYIRGKITDAYDNTTGVTLKVIGVAR